MQPEGSCTQVCCCEPAVQRVCPSVHWLEHDEVTTQVPPLHTRPVPHAAWSTQSVQEFASVWHTTGAPEDAHC